MSMVSVATTAAEPVAVEWAPFVKLSGVADAALLAAADNVNAEFLSVQPGFIKRELVKKSNSNEFADIIHWRSEEDALSAGSKVEQCTTCAEYFKLMDAQGSSGAGAGFSHYTVLQSW